MISLLLNNTTSFHIKKNFFEKILKRTEKLLRSEKNVPIRKFQTNKNFLQWIFSGTIELILLSDPEITVLNKGYRGRNGSTDVLTFSFLEGMIFPEFEEYVSSDVFSVANKTIGEIYISIDTAKSQAREYGHDVFRELEILFVHGILHIFGYEHENVGTEAAKMIALERKILAENT